MCMCDFPPCLSITICVLHAHTFQKWSTGSPGIAECYKLPCRCWELSPSSSGKESSTFSWYPISLALLKLFNRQNYLLVMTENSIFPFRSSDKERKHVSIFCNSGNVFCFKLEDMYIHMYFCKTHLQVIYQHKITQI